jgi:hypothetical protein
MIVETIAAGAITVLSPYLAKAAGKFAEKAGEKLVEKADALYQTIKNYFKGDEDAAQTLALAESKPDSKARLSALEEVLVEKMTVDSTFAEEITQLVEEAKTADSNHVLVFGDRSIGVGGDVSESTFITGDNNTVGKS